MYIQQATLYHVVLPMQFIFTTAKTALPQRDTLVLRLDTEWGAGWGEGVAFTVPFYTDETLAMDWEVLTTRYLPLLRETPVADVEALHQLLDEIEGTIPSDSVLVGQRARYPMARAAVEQAWLWADSLRRGESLVSYWFATPVQPKVSMGVALGLLPVENLVAAVREQVANGCRRVKLKITPDSAYERVARVRDAFPDLQLLVDANRSYALSDWARVAELDGFRLACIEEPFSWQDPKEAQGVQDSLQTPICLDESVQCLADWQQAQSLRIGRMLNVKVGKFGGLWPTRDIISWCQKHQQPFWIGSMVESAISKQLHAQLSGLPGNYMAGDLSASARYFTQDLATPLRFPGGDEVLPVGPGLGISVDEDAVERYAVRKVIL